MDVAQSFDREAFDLVLRYSGQLELVVEVGCGSGAWTRYLGQVARKGVVGVDFSSSLIRKMHEELHSTNCEAVLADALFFPFREASLDQCIFTFSLHHISNVASCLRNVTRCLKNDGLIILIEPNGTARELAYRIGILPHLIGGRKSDPVERSIKIGDTVRTLCRLGFTSIVWPCFGKLRRRRATYPLEKAYLLCLRIVSSVLPSLFVSPDFVLIGRKLSSE